jgi:hypothetical protein
LKNTSTRRNSGRTIPTEITDYLCERTIDELIVSKANAAGFGGKNGFSDIGELIMRLDAPCADTFYSRFYPS